MDVLSRYQWKKVEAPRAWRPRELNEELVGFYGGKTIRNGSFGQYEVALVHVPAKGTWMISGVKLIQLIDTANIGTGWPIRIVWRGTVPLSQGREMRNFDVLVAEGDPLSPDDLPHVKEQAP